MFLEAFLIGFGLRPHATEVGEEVECDSDLKDDENDNEPSEIDKAINPCLLSLSPYKWCLKMTWKSYGADMPNIF